MKRNKISSNPSLPTALPASENHHVSSKVPDKRRRRSRPETNVVELTKCSHQQKLWRSLTRNLKWYWTCFKPVESSKSKSSKISSVVHVEFVKSQKYSNYYSNMNDQERDEVLKSAIAYCRRPQDMSHSEQR